MAYVRGQANALGWREIIEGPDEKHIGHAFPATSTPLLLMHHLSDLHVCDAQSPTRPEYLDRWADPDSPIREKVGTIGTYRPHSMLSPHVVEAMVQALNKITLGPLSGHAIDGAIITGDTTDNAHFTLQSRLLQYFSKDEYLGTNLFPQIVHLAIIITFNIILNHLKTFSV